MDKDTEREEAEGVEDNEDDFDLEIVDDTPDEDKGKPVAPSESESDEITDEELETYSKGVQARIKKLSFNAHSERRAKEAMERQLNESIAVTKRAIEENNSLKDVLHKGEGHLKATNKDRLESKLDAARQEYKTAYEEADADRIAAAQQDMTALQVELQQTKNWDPQPLPRAEVPQRAAPPPVTDDQATGWQEKNKWFGTDVEMTATALGIHQRLVTEQNMDPVTDPKYYQTIDRVMRERYPGKFGKPPTPETEEETAQDDDQEVVTVVAPARRTGKKSAARKKVRLSASQAEIARKLGVSAKDYAAQMLKLG